MKYTDVTVLKIFGRGMSEYWTASGTVIDVPHRDHNCRTQVTVRLNTSSTYFLEHSLANHHVVIPGDHVGSIGEFMSLFNKAT